MNDMNDITDKDMNDMNDITDKDDGGGNDEKTLFPKLQREKVKLIAHQKRA